MNERGFRKGTPFLCQFVIAMPRSSLIVDSLHTLCVATVFIYLDHYKTPIPVIPSESHWDDEESKFEEQSHSVRVPHASVRNDRQYFNMYHSFSSL